jgi:TolA-binding protein
MATDTAQQPTSTPRRLWQLPTFLVGLGSLFALWHAGDRIRPSVSDRYKTAIQALRPAVDRWPADPDQVRAALRKVPDAEPPADLAPQVKYLTGSAYVALAESTNSQTEAEEFWALARRDLEAAADHDLPVPDQKKLRFRLARAWANTGMDADRTIDALTRYVTSGDDPSEGYRLLAKLYRAKTPPDDVGARGALQNFLKYASARADARALNQARVDLAGLHVKLGETEEAKKVLDRVGPDAPPELFAAARLKAAGLLRTEGDWAGSAKVLSQVREMKGALDEQLNEARTRLAEAYVKLGKPEEAERLFAEVGKSDGPENALVFFREAESIAQDPIAPKDSAVAALEKAVSGPDLIAVRKTIPAADAKRVCETIFQQAKVANDFPRALRVAQVYAKLSEDGDHHRMLAEANLAWAEASTGDEAKERYRVAADTYTQLSRASLDPANRADWSRKSAGLYVKAGDRSKALALLAELTEQMREYPADRAGPAWLEIGDVYNLANETTEAQRAYQTAAGLPGPDRDRASIRYASLAYQSDPEKAGLQAIALLQEVLSHKPGEDTTLSEEARYLLGEIYLVRKEWNEAEASLKSALDSYPKSNRAARAHYQYGQVLRHTAYESARKIKADREVLEQIKAERIAVRQPALKVDEQIKLEDRIDRSQKNYEELMRQALSEFGRTEALMLAKPDIADPEVIRRSSFWAADCAYWLGDFADSASRCEKLAVRYRGRVEELEAGRDLHRCCQFAAVAARDAKDPDGSSAWSKRATEAVSRIRDALSRVPLSEFDGKVESHRKEYWDAWLAENGARGRVTE